MNIKVDGITYTCDLDTGFIMQQVCYQDGLNCCNCLEECDALDVLEQLYEEQEKHR